MIMIIIILEFEQYAQYGKKDTAYASITYLFMIMITIKSRYLRGESKFETSTLSVNPKLRGWEGQPFDAKECICVVPC